MPHNVLQAVGPHHINKEGGVPRYQQVRDIIYRLVQSGHYRPGDRIPAELQLADLLGVSKMTVNKAVLSLAADGLLIREVGRGTFVAGPTMAPLPTLHPKSTEIETGSRKIALSFVEGARDVLDSAYYGGIYRGVAALLEESGETAEISLSTTPAEECHVEDDRNAVDGRLIFAPRASSIPAIEYLWYRRRVPLVVIGASWPNLNAPALDSDNVGGAFAAVRYLVEWGHRRIALLLAEPESANTQDRISGYRRALLVSGIAPSPDYEIEAASSWKSGEVAEKRLIQLLNDDEPVTAIFAAGHCLALEALNAARLAGKRVPQEVSVIGYDDTPASALVHPALTVMRQPLFEMGRRAAERLLRLMNDPDAERVAPVVRELLPAELIVRESVTSPTRVRKLPQRLLEEGIGGA